MSQEQIHIIAIIHPTAGKVDRLKTLLAEMCKDVHAKEDYTLRYMATEQISLDDSSNAPETPDIVMIETYKDKASADKHRTEAHFKELFARINEEGLTASPPYIGRTKNFAGFDLDRTLT